METQSRSLLWQRPTTRRGWWAAGLGAAFVMMYLVNTLVFMPAFSYAITPGLWNILLPFYAISMVLCGLSSGILGLLALIRSRERSWLVWLTLLPGAFVIFLLVGELLFPH
jgi:hypothetical protein